MVSMLDAKEHERILADMDHVCAVAGVQSLFLKGSMVDYCGDVEIAWVTKFHRHRADGCPGLLLEGVANPDTRCQAIAGALLRNYLDARVIPMNTLLAYVSDGGVPSPTVLLIPNLYLAAMNKSLPAWRVQQLYDLLLERSTQNKPSVVYVDNLPSLRAVYGAPFCDFLGRFLKVTEAGVEAA